MPDTQTSAREDLRDRDDPPRTQGADPGDPRHRRAVGAAAGAWYLFVRQAGPPPVVLASSSPGATSAGAPSPDGDGAFTAGSIDGTWSVEIEKPQAMIVLSVEDGGTLELQLQLTGG